jgi:ABC-type phosphate transport system substrate-binding protein
MRLRRYGVFLGVLLGAAAPAAAEDFQVIVHASLLVSEIPRADVARFYLRQTLKWGDGQAVLPIDQSARSAIREAFCKGVLKQPLPVVEAYWQRQIASGRAVPPPVKATDAEVLAYVSATPGAIGYVVAGMNLPAGVKLVKLKE